MTTVLIRADKGGHRATPRWTRHLVRYADGYSTCCGVSTFAALRGDERGTQGEIKDCKRCKRIFVVVGELRDFVRPQEREK